MKTQTSELTGTALDWAVASIEGTITDARGMGVTRFPAVKLWLNQEQGTYTLPILDGPATRAVIDRCDDWPLYLSQKFYRPSKDWSQGGPIIERERLNIRQGREGILAFKFVYGTPCNRQEGATPLIAAMRCYVASNLGDEVDVPKEFL